MLDKSFGLLFYLKKPKDYKKGNIPIYLRVTVDGSSSELSIKRSWHPDRWNSHAGRATGTKEEAKALNSFLDTIQNKVYNAKRKLIEADNIISAVSIKELLVGNIHRNKYLNQIFRAYNERVHELVGKDYSKGTHKKYDSTQFLIELFIRDQYSKEDIHIKQLNFEFISDLEVWFKTKRNCSHNTTMKYLSILKMIIIFCINNRWLDHDPFAGFTLTQEQKDPEFLLPDELELVENTHISIDRLKKVRDVFIFCCYSGLAYADVEKLKRSEIVMGIDGKLWIFSDRLKTNVRSRIPLLQKAQAILKKYENDIECLNADKVLPVLSNQKYNSYLKEIAKICGITKRLTTHTARHTFATTITLTNGVPIESVKKMLGHKTLTTTQRYARVIDIKLSEDMERLNDRLNSTLKTHGE